MKREEIEQRVVELVALKGKVDADQTVDLTASIDMYFNSITYIQFLIALEEAFDFELGDEELNPANFHNFYDVIDHIQKQLT